MPISVRHCGAVLALSLAAALPAQAAERWLNGSSGTDCSSCGTQTTPYRNFWYALNAMSAGDTLHIMPKSGGAAYTEMFYIDKSGTTDKPLTFVGGDSTNATRPKISVANNFGVLIDSESWIRIQNLDIVATGATVSGVHSNNGSHHIEIIDNYIHDSGAGGIILSGSDYITIRDNLVVRNAKNMTQVCGSGISLYQLRNSDSSTAVKNRISNNEVAFNINDPDDGVWEGGASCDHGDGNGIIIDDSRNTQNGSTAGTYKGGTVLFNNVVYANGGRGVHIYRSDNVYVVNNTVAYNNKDPHESSWKPGEVMAVESGNVQIFNNILHSDGGYVADDGSGNPHMALSLEKLSGSATINVNNNIIWNSTANQAQAIYAPTDGNHANTAPLAIAGWGKYNLWTDPMFNDTKVSDYRVKSGSKAFGLGNGYYAPGTDIWLEDRATYPTVGAYEKAAQ